MYRKWEKNKKQKRNAYRSRDRVSGLVYLSRYREINCIPINEWSANTAIWQRICICVQTCLVRSVLCSCFPIHRCSCPYPQFRCPPSIPSPTVSVLPWSLHLLIGWFSGKELGRLVRQGQSAVPTSTLRRPWVLAFAVRVRVCVSVKVEIKWVLGMDGVMHL